MNVLSNPIDPGPITPARVGGYHSMKVLGKETTTAIYLGEAEMDPFNGTGSPAGGVKER